MVSTIIRDGLVESRRAVHEKIGNEGEQAVAYLLAEVFGHNKVSHGKEGYSEGTNGCPDLVLLLDRPIAIEVKSTVPFTKYFTRYKTESKRASSIKINKFQWAEEMRFAKERLMRFILVVEIRLHGSKKGNLYFWLSSDIVNEFVERCKGTYTHLTIWDILRNGNRLITKEDIENLALYDGVVEIDHPQSQLIIR